MSSTYYALAQRVYQLSHRNLMSDSRIRCGRGMDARQATVHRALGPVAVLDEGDDVRRLPWWLRRPDATGSNRGDDLSPRSADPRREPRPSRIEYQHRPQFGFNWVELIRVVKQRVNARSGAESSSTGPVHGQPSGGARSPTPLCAGVRITRKSPHFAWKRGLSRRYGSGAGQTRSKAPSAALIASTRSLASPKSIWVFSRKNSGFCTPA